LLLNNDILSTVHDVSRKCVTRAAQADGWWSPGRHPRPGGPVLLWQADQFLIGGDTYQAGEPHPGHAKGKMDGAGWVDMAEGTIPLMFKA